MSRPERIHLSAEECEAILARLSVYAPSHADCEILAQVLRLYFWLMVTVEEAKVRMRRLRRVLFGRGRQAKEPPEPAASTPSSEALGEGEGGGEWVSVEENTAGTSVVVEEEAGALPIESLSKAKGGHRPGTGRLGAEAYEGAERVECRHEELAVGQRCPVCGQGTLYALPPGVEMRLDGHALLSAMRYELEKFRCSACGAIFTAEFPAGGGAREIQRPGPCGAGREPVLPGGSGLSPARRSGDAGGPGARCDAVGPDREGGRLCRQGV